MEGPCLFGDLPLYFTFEEAPKGHLEVSAGSCPYLDFSTAEETFSDPRHVVPSIGP